MLRSKFYSPLISSILLCAVTVLSGCGGQTAAKTATVTGTVVDVNLKPVRSATVKTQYGSTVSNETGAFVLLKQTASDLEIVATVTTNGVTYRGRTNVLNFDGQQTNAGNIMVAATGSLGSLTGTVSDRAANLIEGASVFANSGNGSSVRVRTNRTGDYTLPDLIAGINYVVSATSQGFGSDQTNYTIVANNTGVLNFSLNDPAIPNLPKPTNLGIVTWTSFPGSRGVSSSPVEWARRHAGFKGKPTVKSRSIRTDMIVEADLTWDRFASNNLYGWGIYRSTDNASVASYDFLFDPLGADYVDIGLNPNGDYNYAVAGLATVYPNQKPQSQGPLSDTVGVSTLGLIGATQASGSGQNWTFSVLGGSGATTYVAYVFDQFPIVGVDSMWNNEANPTASLSINYAGPSLQKGHTYYYFVMGLANSNTSRTISAVQTFLP